MTSLFRFFNSSQEMNSRVQLGAQVFQIFSGELILKDQGGELVIPRISGEPPCEVGDRIEIEFNTNDLETTLPLKELNIKKAKVSQLHSLKIISKKGGTAPKRSNYSYESNHKWNQFLAVIRESLRDISLIEVSTPTLVASPGMEHTLESFSTELVYGRRKKRMYLPTSPEFALKKLLAENWTDIFEIRRCFRNEEKSEKHDMEFTMLEWYRAYSALDQIKEDLQHLIGAFTRNTNAVKGEKVKFQEFTVAELFERHLQFCFTPQTTTTELLELAYSKGLHLDNADWNMLFSTLMAIKIEPAIANYREPIFVYNYPPQQCALAKINSQGWADRLELYWKGVELANAYNELIDPNEFLARCESENEKRLEVQKGFHEIDRELFDCLKSGLAPTAGVALGLDRLFMVLNGYKSFSDFRWVNEFT